MNHILSAVLYTISALSLVIIYYCYRYRNIKGAKAFGILIVTLFFNSTGYAGELLSYELSEMLFWVRIEYLGIPFMPVAVLYFIREYTDERKFINNVLLMSVFILNIVTFLLAQTNAYHYLYYSHVDVSFTYEFPVFIFERGIGYQLHSAIMVFTFVYSLAIMLKRIIEIKGSYRKRSIIMVIGLLMPTLSAAYYYFELGPAYIDVTTFSSFLLSIVVLFGLFRYNIVFFSQVTHEMILNTIEEAVLVVDDEQHVVSKNTVTSFYFEELAKVKVGERVEDYPLLLELVDGDDMAEFACENRYFQVRNIRMDSSHARVLVFTDITENYLTKQKLEDMALTDPLTSLYNRRHFVERFNEEAEEGVIILIDVDYFKQINDTYGHSEGDRVLVDLSQYICETLPDAVVCRYGGEEFLLYQTNISLEDGIAFAEKLRMGVQARQDLASCTISIGICNYFVGDFIASINRVDDLLYEAKNSGRNQVKACQKPLTSS